jgi:hypothetical protein
MHQNAKNPYPGGKRFLKLPVSNPLPLLDRQFLPNHPFPWSTFQSPTRRTNPLEQPFSLLDSHCHRIEPPVIGQKAYFLPSRLKWEVASMAQVKDEVPPHLGYPHSPT